MGTSWPWSRAWRLLDFFAVCASHCHGAVVITSTRPWLWRCRGNSKCNNSKNVTEGSFIADKRKHLGVFKAMYMFARSRLDGHRKANVSALVWWTTALLILCSATSRLTCYTPPPCRRLGILLPTRSVRIRPQYSKSLCCWIRQTHPQRGKVTTNTAETSHSHIKKRARVLNSFQGVKGEKLNEKLQELVFRFNNRSADLFHIFFISWLLSALVANRWHRQTFLSPVFVICAPTRFFSLSWY